MSLRPYILLLLIIMLFVFFGIEFPKEDQNGFAMKSPPLFSKVKGPISRNLTLEEGQSVPQRTIDLTNFYLEKHRRDLNLQPYHEFRPAYFGSPDSSYVRYDVYQDGIWVWDMHLIFTVNEKGEITQKNIQYSPIEKLYFNVKDFENLKEVLPEKYKIKTLSEPTKVIFTETSDPTIAYVVEAIEKQSKKPLQLIVRATDGLVLKKIRKRAEF